MVVSVATLVSGGVFSEQVIVMLRAEVPRQLEPGGVARQRSTAAEDTVAKANGEVARALAILEVARVAAEAAHRELYAARMAADGTAGAHKVAPQPRIATPQSAAAMVAPRGSTAAEIARRNMAPLGRRSQQRLHRSGRPRRR